MSKAKARVFVPLYKVDEEQRLVYGRITAQEIDQSGEVMDYASSKPLFEKWSSGIEEASGGLSKGNLRVMHGLQVAGKLTDMAFNDDEEAIEVCAKVVDDSQWNMVLEGCYTGFSVGGKYEKRWKENLNGQQVTKYTANPNEVSLVDNPCVKSATFSCIKAAGVVEEIAFKKVAETAAEPKAQDKSAEAQAAVVTEPSNDEVVAKAMDIAKAANDGSTWMDHVTAARDALMKTTPLGLAAEQLAEERRGEEAKAESEEGGSDQGAEETATGNAEPTAESVSKVTPPGVKQKWEASDGTTFEKKADAEAHEAKLAKTHRELTEAEQLAARLNKALEAPKDENEEPELPLMQDPERLSKVVAALTTPFEDGQPKLEKGMYTINRFSNVLSDLASLSRSIKAEGAQEGDGDGSDASISADLINACKALGKSFLDYAADQITELLAGMDDDVVVTYYDYYYNAAKEEGADALAKDVCQVIDELKDASREQRENLSKAFGFSNTAPVEIDLTDLPPPLQKRFDELTATAEDMKKVAENAVSKVEELAARLQKVEETPLPRAPAAPILRPGDESFFGKTVKTEEDKVQVLAELLKSEGPEALAIRMIKAAHATGGQQLTLSR